MKAKVIVAILAVAALSLAAVGLAAAQLAQNQTQPIPGSESNSAVPIEGFWGWIGNCFGYRVAQPYEGQYVTPPTGSDKSAPEPYNPYQDGYGYQRGYEYGYVPCWAR